MSGEESEKTRNTYHPKNYIMKGEHILWWIVPYSDSCDVNETFCRVFKSISHPMFLIVWTRSASCFLSIMESSIYHYFLRHGIVIKFEEFTPRHDIIHLIYKCEYIGMLSYYLKLQTILIWYVLYLIEIFWGIFQIVSERKYSH